MAVFYQIAIYIDSIIYWFIDVTYQIFWYVAGAQLFTSDSLKTLINNMYIVMGVVMLFMLAYSMLNSIINPDKAGSSETGPNKVVQNTIITLVMLVLAPSVFNFLYTVQNVVLTTNVIGNIVSNAPSDNNDLSVDDDNNISLISEDASKFGAELASDIYKNFMVINDGKSASEVEGDINKCNFTNVLTCSPEIITFDQIDSNISEHGFYKTYSAFSESIADGDILYMIIVSGIIGAFIVYMLVSFTFDLSIRAVKLAYLQIIAPIPIIFNIVPKGKSVFKNWVGKVSATYFEVFVRIAVIFFMVVMINLFKDFDINMSGNNSIIEGIAFVFIVTGIIAFAKMAPGFIGETFGIKSGSLKLGIGEKLQAGTVIPGAGALKGSAVGFARRWNSIEGKGQNKLLRSLGAGALGGAKGFQKSLGAKNHADLKKAGNEAVAEVDKKNDENDMIRQRSKTETAPRMTDSYNKFMTTIGANKPANLDKYNGLINQYDAVENAANKLIEKNMDNAKLIQTTNFDTYTKDTWKGGQAAMDAYKDLKGLSLSSMEQILASERASNPVASLKPRAGETEIREEDILNARKVHAERITGMTSMINQLKTDTNKMLQDEAFSPSANFSADYGINPEKLKDLNSEIKVFQDIAFESGEGDITSLPGKMSEKMDNKTSEYKDNRSRDRAEAAAAARNKPSS